MKKINQMICFVIVVFGFVIALVNLCLIPLGMKQDGKEYRVSLNRIRQAVVDYENEKGKAAEHLEDLRQFWEEEEFSFITELSAISRQGSDQESLSCFLTEQERDYAILVTGQTYYKVIYRNSSTQMGWIFGCVNGVCFFSLCLLVCILLYIRNAILLPFDKLSDVPYELSRGNMILPLKENKNRYFGKFVWGMELLRERLEGNRQRELELQREKKMLLLSLFHDIKTPLSAIKLYAKALIKNLYQEEKRQGIAGHIDEKVEEIEQYISEIVRASNEDFLHFDVENGEVYLRDVVEEIREYYSEKMQLNQIVFEVGEYQNCLVYGDDRRLVEVLQNIIENAIKYGDGRKIWITSQRDEEEVVVSIFNTGCNLEEKELHHIFDSFFRGSNVGKKQGSGLGLYICRQLMHQMEGEVSARVLQGNIMEVKVAVHLI